MDRATDIALNGSKVKDVNGNTDFQTDLVAGIPFQRTELSTAVSWLQAAVLKKLPVSVRLANAYCVALADRDEEYFNLLSSEGVNFPDGQPVVWHMNIRSGAKCRAGRVRGPSFFVESLAAGVGVGMRHYFLGSTDETLKALSSWASSRFPGIRIVGRYSPPFAPVTPEYIDECAAKVISSNADVIWLGLGTPKQDIVGTKLAALTGRPAIGVGAAFDFAAGTVREAPRWIQKSGFEWLYRLSREPKRLWKRYLFGNFQFLRALYSNSHRWEKGKVTSK